MVTPHAAEINCPDFDTWNVECPCGWRIIGLPDSVIATKTAREHNGETGERPEQRVSDGNLWWRRLVWRLRS